MLFLDGRPLHDAVVFFHHTFGYQFGRSSPVLRSGIGAAGHAKGIPDLHLVQRALQVALVAGALALYRWPRRRSPLQIAAFTGALLVGSSRWCSPNWSRSYLAVVLPAFVAYAPSSPRRADEVPAVASGISGAPEEPAGSERQALPPGYATAARAFA